MDYARRMLENRADISIGRLAVEVGYVDSRTFSKAFKKRFGRLPSDFLND